MWLTVYKIFSHTITHVTLTATWEEDVFMTLESKLISSLVSCNFFPCLKPFRDSTQPTKSKSLSMVFHVLWDSGPLPFFLLLWAQADGITCCVPNLPGRSMSLSSPSNWMSPSHSHPKLWLVNTYVSSVWNALLPSQAWWTPAYLSGLRWNSSSSEKPLLYLLPPVRANTPSVPWAGIGGGSSIIWHCSGHCSWPLNIFHPKSYSNSVLQSHPS